MKEKIGLKIISAFAWLLIIVLSGCFGGDRVYIAKHHGIDIEKISIYLQENYRSGTDEKNLIREFTAKGYRYIPPNSSNQKRRLLYPNPCPPSFYDMGEQVYIAWTSDNKGMISVIEKPQITLCGVIYP